VLQRPSPTLSSFGRMFQDGQDLIAEIVIFQTLVDEEVTPVQALAELKKKTGGSFPNIPIALRIRLTTPAVTSVCAERRFLKFKTIKSYLRNSIRQNILSNLA